MNGYTEDFYRSRDERTRHSAETILEIIDQLVPEVHSATDVGCGVGTWLSVLKNRGVQEIRGFDGNWVNSDLLQIPEACFENVDLSTGVVTADRRFDLAISLEVAEHLSSDAAFAFVTSLTKLSDTVLFSAAIPHQGGNQHVNEQWQGYWADLFSKLDYAPYDVVRSKIWNDPEIPFWYKQNILVFSNRSDLRNSPTTMPIDVVHPDMYQHNLDAVMTIKGSLSLLGYATKKRLRKQFGLG